MVKTASKAKRAQADARVPDLPVLASEGLDRNVTGIVGTSAFDAILTPTPAPEEPSAAGWTPPQSLYDEDEEREEEEDDVDALLDHINAPVHDAPSLFEAAALGPPDLTLEEARERVARINTRLSDARQAAFELYTRRGWKALGYRSWLDCCKAEFGNSRQHVERMADAAAIEADLAPMGASHLPERQLRELKRLPTAELRREAYLNAIETAEDAPIPKGKAGKFHQPGKVTAQIIKAAVDEIRPAAPPAPRTERAASDLFTDPYFQSVRLDTSGTVYIFEVVSPSGETFKMRVPKEALP